MHGDCIPGFNNVAMLKAVLKHLFLYYFKGFVFKGRDVTVYAEIEKYETKKCLYVR